MSATVKIVRCHKIGGPEVLQFDELPLPEPAQGEVCLRVKAIGLNRAEIMFRNGQYLETPVPPSKNGYEAAGIIEAVGPAVTKYKPGLRVSAEGHITAAPFFETSSSSAARRFVDSFKNKYGPDAPVTACAEAAYFQLHLAMRAVAKCGSDDPEQVLTNLRDAEFDAPQGRVRIDRENNHTYLWPRIARLDRNGRFQTVWNPGVRVKPDPYCVVQSLDDWSVDDLQLLHP